ncbi:MAG: type I-E CRISPR-associated protein Cse2/CasB [Promethearchaeia archaeon]|nr:MAG: type I-E CRISPR-associated protein Cse2/CasB [Candidatus Lokiarchaeia archaeon]
MESVNPSQNKQKSKKSQKMQQASSNKSTGEEKKLKERTHHKTEVFRKFLSSLEKLEDSNRGMYAVLKRASGTILGDSIPAMSAFYKILPYSEQNSRLEPIYYLIATLFPIQPLSGTGNFGKSMALTKKQFGEPDSIDHRFQNLLESSLDSSSFDPKYGDLDSFREFSYRLRQCVSLVASKQVGISWYNLLTDLYFWSRDLDNSRRVQKEWARAYYGASRDSSSESKDETN